MNSATKNLENDHVYILRLIDVMEKITGINRPDIGNLETVVNLIKNYADGMHHEKEENLFFPMLAKKGFSLQQGPVAVMLQEHTQGRKFVSGIVEGIRKYKEGDENAVQEIFGNMKGYISLLRNHIAKENNILFRMADKVLNDNDNHILLNEFSKVEKGKSGEILSDSWIRSIENLEDLYMH